MTDRYAAYTSLKIDYPSKRILRLTFDRPETYNSVDAQTHTQLTHIWRDINDDPDISAVIVTGAGKAFSAGGDFELIKSILDNPSARMATWKEAKDLVYNVINCNKPIISAINGVAVGAGLVVGILADISICGKSARIVDGHTRLGVAAGDVACIIWPLLCGLAKAKYYLLTCKPLSGTEAERIGLVSLCVEDDRAAKGCAGNCRGSGNRRAERDPLDQICPEQLASRQRAAVRHLDRAGNARLHRRRGTGRARVASREAQAGIPAGLPDLTHCVAGVV